MNEESILKNISGPGDIKNLNFKQLDVLAKEIRSLIIETVAQTGGHLASNLGNVEVTVALHKVFDFSKDKIIFDVSHQAYAHKILTGRKELFNSLRQYNGISGYTNPSESKYDAFLAGHASTSLALALGFVKSRELKKENYEVVALVGDGALTGGEAYEGLNNLGQLGKKALIVLNDNEMSISRNVGSISRLLSKLRSSSLYQSLKKNIVKTSLIRKIKLSIKELFLPTTFFEELGFTYLGPIDGHNLKELIETFQRTKNILNPVVVHVITKKGKGYSFAEANPTKFHSAEPFEIDTGISHKKSGSKTFSEIFGETLVEEGSKDPKIFVITAAMSDGTKTNLFKKAFPERFLDVGIAEQCAVTTAAALAKDGFKPVVAIYSTFIQRAYDQLVHDVGISNLPVVFALDRSGVVSDDGPTHQGVFDLSFIRTIPNFVIAAPKDDFELKEMLKIALNYDGPFVIRFPKDVADPFIASPPVWFGKAEIISEGKDLLIVSIGAIFNRAYKAREILESRKISTGLINARFVKPLDKNVIINNALKAGKVLTIEDNTVLGGFGSSINELLSDFEVRVKNIGISDMFPEQGKRNFLLDKYGLDPGEIANVGEKFAKEKG
jgi:1-deoxy-D-xylulose-5-phosphate synthase